MNTKINYTIYIILFLLLFTSCKKEEENIIPPARPLITNFTVIADGEKQKDTIKGTFYPTAEIVFEFLAIDMHGLELLKVLEVSGGVSKELKKIFLNQKTEEFSIEYKVKNLPESSVFITFILVNSNEMITERSYEIEILHDAQPVIINSGINLGYQNDTVRGNFYDAHNNIVYNQSEADTSPHYIDLIYWYDASFNASIGSPIDPVFSQEINNPYPEIKNWSYRKGTKLGKTVLSRQDFIGIYDDYQILEHAIGLNETKVTQLKKDDVIAFELENGKKGLFIVEHISNIPPDEEFNIIITVKMQE